MVSTVGSLRDSEGGSTSCLTPGLSVAMSLECGLHLPIVVLGFGLGVLRSTLNPDVLFVSVVVVRTVRNHSSTDLQQASN